MEYTDKELEQVEQYASIYLKISDMAVILGVRRWARLSPLRILTAICLTWRMMSDMNIL